MTQPHAYPDLYSGTQCAALDGLALNDWGFSADQLMARAGEFALAQLSQRWPQARRLGICAGVGNNAGDGYVLAERAQRQGYSVVVLQLHNRALVGAAGRAQQAAREAGVSILGIEAADVAGEAVAGLLASDLVLVDALLGIGLEAPPRPAFAALIQAMNRSAAPVLALDVPSGLDADASAPFADAVQAALTATFIVDKLCLHTGAGKALAGEVRVSALGLPARLLSTLPGCGQLRAETAKLPPLPAGAYKHHRGHVVVVGGDHGMHGAVLLSAEAALRSGAGLVSVITRAAALPGLLAHRPELMVVDAALWPQVQGLLARASVVVCGPGLGQGAWGRGLLAAVLATASSAQPPQLVLDADALNLLAQQPEFAAPGAVITPHSGEAARLLGISSALVERDRVRAARQLAQRFSGVAVLKGPGSLVASAEQIRLCSHGNAGMATAGMGDVLAGLTAGLLAQRGRAKAATGALELVAETVGTAVALHSAAADLAAAQLGQRALIASDLLAALPGLLAAAE